MRTPRAEILPALFLAGAASILTQVLFVREALVVFLGNELTLGILIGAWLLGIGGGSLLARGAAPPRAGDHAHSLRLLAAVWLLPGLLLPLQVYALRGLRMLLGVPPGELVALSRTVWVALLVSAPTTLCVGAAFPLAVRALAFAARRGVDGEPDAAAHAGRAYAVESAGSMAGGAMLSFVLLPLLSPLRLSCLAMAAWTAAAALALPARQRPRPALLLPLFLVGVALWNGPTLRGLERRWVERRWQSFGVLPRADGAAGGSPPVRLIADRDSIYQNLALTESAGQFALYGNGEVLFVFPDDWTVEQEAHVLMAQRPSARRVLVLGGNPLGVVPAILRYPVRGVVHVDLDPAVSDLVRLARPESYDRLAADPRVTRVRGDAFRVVRRCRTRFDLVVVNAPPPSSTANSRFYTVEFYTAIRRILAPGGVLCASIESSERLQTDAARLAASVYGALRAVFPEVLVTAESRCRLIASDRGAGATLDRRTLYARDRAAAVPSEHFRPEYFLGCDEMDPEKTRAVRARLESQNVPPNRLFRPVAFLQELVLWSQYSGSSVERVLRRVQDPCVRRAGVAAGAVLAGLLCAAGVAVRLFAGPSGRQRWFRATLSVSMASTGFAGIAIEMCLIFLFQALFGYVYSRIGLMVAVFMLGLVFGGLSGVWPARRGRGARTAFIGLDGVLALIPLAVAAAASAGAGLPGAVAETLIYVAMALAGWGVGAQFPLAARLYVAAGGSAAGAVATANAADHIGAALGGLVIAVLCVPILGIVGACVAVSSLKAVSLLGLLFAK